MDRARSNNAAKAALPLIVLAGLLAAAAVSCQGKGMKDRDGRAPGQAVPVQAAKGGASAPASPEAAAGQGDSPPVLQMQPVQPASSEAAPPAQGPSAPSADSGGEAPSRLPPAAAPPQEPALPASILAERGFGLAAPLGPLLPEDNLIGPLQDWRGGNDSEREALKAAAAFLDGLVAGRLPEDLVAPGRLPIVSMLARDLLAGPRPGSYRIGAFRDAGTPGDESRSARVALSFPAFGPAAGQAAGAGSPALAGTAEPAGGGQASWVTGEIGLRRIKGIWYIESVTFDGAPS